jgi:hypothetical protein
VDVRQSFASILQLVQVNWQTSALLWHFMFSWQQILRLQSSEVWCCAPQFWRSFDGGRRFPCNIVQIYQTMWCCISDDQNLIFAVVVLSA